LPVTAVFTECNLFWERELCADLFRTIA
jgi:hypothetical protein